MNRNHLFTSAIVISLAFSPQLVHLPIASAWDSNKGNPTHPTHSYLTEWGIDQLKGQHPELQQYRRSQLQRS